MFNMLSLCIDEMCDWFFSNTTTSQQPPPAPAPRIQSQPQVQKTAKAICEPWIRPNTPTQPFRPPDTWDAHKKCPRSCQCAKSRPLGIDPLLAAAHHNMVCSPLHKLPEELLLEIMGHLDLPGLQCLRGASRLFLRLYCSPQFSDGHEAEDFHKHLKSQHWLQPSYGCWHHALRKTHTRRLACDIEDLCTECRHRRLQPAWAQEVFKLTKHVLFCYGCQTYHPRALFSRAQRRSGKGRICIGREGYVRLCCHKTITWSQISDWAGYCATMKTSSCGAIPRIKLFECEHESHLPTHHGPHSATIALNSNIRPQVSIQGDSSNRKAVVLQWNGHLRVNDPGHQPTSPALLHQQFQRFRESVARYLAPELPPGRLPEMNCFDPNQCSCLRFEGMESLRGSHLVPPAQLKLNSCRVQPEFRLGALQPESREALNHPGSHREPWVGAHRSMLQSIGTGSLGCSIIKIGVDPCLGADDRCLSIKYERTIDVSSAHHEPALPDRVTMAWCQALDPNSYKLTEDTETFGMFWCREPGCRNYYKYMRKAEVNPRVAFDAGSF